MLTHAGGIVARLVNGEREYLIVSSRRNPGHWVFPKGHIDPGEEPEETALRELREEAGARADIVAPVGENEFELPTERARVLYFAMRYRASCEPDEQREIRWCRYEDAIALLSFENDRELLRSARAVLSAA